MKKVRNISLALAALAGMIAFGVAQAESFNHDAVHSSVYFRISHVGMSWTYGRFNDVSAAVNWNDAKLGESYLNFKIKADSIDTGDAKRDGHVKGPDFLDAEEHPVISFTSKKIVKGAEDGVFDITGDLSIRGKTKEMTIPVTKMGEGDDPFAKDKKIRIGFGTEFDIDRHDFGVDGYKGAIGAEVRLMVSFEATRDK